MANVPHIGVCDAPFIAGADLSASANRYKFVALSSGGTAGASGSADKIIKGTGASLPTPLGILQNCPCANEEAAVAVYGFSKLRVRSASDANFATAGSPIYQGNFLTCGEDGWGIKVTPGAGSPALARAMQDCTSGSAIINVLLLPGAAYQTAS